MALSIKSENGLVHVPSKYPVRKALERLETLVQSRGLTIFARIDFAGDAQKVGLTMRPTQLLIFGNPKAGTPLMVVSPSIAIDLPLKALAWEDVDGKVWLSYNKPEYLKERHGVPADLLKNILAIGALVEEAVK